jgi:uncharacterized protein YybS (DUF2232 family)
VITFLLAAAGGLMLMVGSAFMYYRLEWKALLIFAVMIAAALIATGRSFDAPLMITPFLLGGIGGYTFKKGKGFGFFMLTTSIPLAVLFTGFFYYLMIYQNVDFIGLLRGEVVRFMEAAGRGHDIKGQMLSEFDASREDIMARVPFSSFLNSVALSGLGYAIIKRFFSRMAQAPAGPGLEAFRLNEYFIFVLIAGLAAYLLIDKSDYPVLHSGGLNVALIAALLYFVQALGLIKYLLLKRGLPGYILPLGLSVILILGIWMALFLFVFLAGVGALDVWADFRTLIGKNEPKI